MPASSPAVLPPAAQTEEFDYTDVSTFETTGKVACLLCQRQFKSEDILRKHVAQSDLHKARIYPFYSVSCSGFRAMMTRTDLCSWILPCLSSIITTPSSFANVFGPTEQPAGCRDMSSWSTPQSSHKLIDIYAGTVYIDLPRPSRRAS